MHQAEKLMLPVWSAGRDEGGMGEQHEKDTCFQVGHVQKRLNRVAEQDRSIVHNIHSGTHFT